MDWKSIAGTLIKAGAPAIGTALGGPLGGMIGMGLGSVIASALGVPATPDAVNTAITTGDPQVIQAQLSAAEAEAQAKWPALAQIAQAQWQAESAVGTAQVNAIGETMRAELDHGAWYQRLWRPFLMYLWGCTWPWQLWTVLYATDVTQRASILYALAAWNAVPSSIAGVYAWGRTKEKIASFIPPLPGPAGVVQRVIKAVRGR